MTNSNNLDLQFHTKTGIVNCELIAKGLINALKVIDVPLVVRLEGTNEKEAKQLLAQHSDRIISAENLEEAAKLAVQASLNANA